MDQIDDITECCICAEMFTDPRMLPCIHTFCLKCLEATRSKSETDTGDTMPCPIYMQQFAIPPDGLSGLRKNFFMETLMEIAITSKPIKSKVSCGECLINKDDANIEVPDASDYCVQCRENMCEMCSVEHKHQKLSKGHQIVPFGSQLKDELVKASVDTYCNQHTEEELKVYCTDCKKVICRMCFTESHKMHKCSDARKVADAFKDEIGIFQMKVVEGSRDGLARKLQLEQEKRKFMEESAIAETTIKESANKLKELIDKHATVLLDELVQRKATRMKETETKNEEIEIYLALVNSFNAYCSEIKSKGTPTDICRSVNDLRSRANELQGVYATQIKQDTSVAHVSFKTSSMEDILKVENIAGSLEVQTKSLATIKTNKEQPVQTKSLSTIKAIKEQPVCLDFIERLQCPKNVLAVTKLGDKIYIMCRESLACGMGIGTTTICVFEDRDPFQLYKNIHMRKIIGFQHVVSSDQLKCLYISDWQKRCIWKLTADKCRVTQWLPKVIAPFTLSASNDGHPLLLRDVEGVSQLEIYGSDAKIIRSIALPRDITSPLHIIQEPNGQFITIHQLDDSWSGSWVISELMDDGQILRQFQPKEKYEELMNPFNLSLDSENNRLFVAQKDTLSYSVVMFDLGSLEWKQILLTSEEVLPFRGLQLHYDERKKQLLVGKLEEVVVYQIY